MGNRRPRTLAEYFEIAWRRKWLILIYTTGVALAAWAFASGLPSVYESRSVLVISERAGKDPEARSLRISTARQRVLSTQNLEDLIGRYHLKSVAESSDRAVQRLRSQITIETRISNSHPPIPEALYVSYRHTDPAVAQGVVTNVVATLNRANEMLSHRASIEAGWLGSQLAQLEKQLTTLSQRSATKAASMGDPEAARMALVSAIDSLKDREYALAQQIKEQERQIREQRKVAGKGSAYGDLLLRKTELTAQLRNYASQYTAKNPKVLQAKTEIAEVDRQLAILADKNQSGPASSDILSLERDLVRLQTDMELARREARRKAEDLETLSRLYGANTRGYRNSGAEAEASYERVGRRYYSLLEQRDELQRAGISGAWEPPLFQVIDLPNVPQEPVAPNRLKLGAFALALGLGAGLVMLAFFEAQKMVFIRDQDDVAYFLGVPVLTAIPETLSPVERNLKWRKALASRLGVVLLVAALPGLAFAMRHAKVLQSVVVR